MASLDRWIRDNLVPPAMQVRRRVRREHQRGSPEFKLLTGLVRPGRCALDVGSYYGVWAYRMRELTDVVHAFEPHPMLHARLERAMGGQVQVHNVALSDRTGEAEFRIPHRDGGYSLPGGSLNPLATGEEFQALRVETARLDDFNIHSVGFIKIDVEGNESAVLAGGKDTIARDRPTMLIEIMEEHRGRAIGDLIAEVEALGYYAEALVLGELRPWKEGAGHGFGNKRGQIHNFVFRPRS